jgi:hypothetical protein
MKRIELITFGPLQPPYKLKPKQKCLMTQKATHDPMHKRKLLQPPNSHPQCSPFNINVDLRKEEGGKKKNLGPLFHFLNWLSRILILNLSATIFARTIMPKALIEIQDVRNSFAGSHSEHRWGYESHILHPPLTHPQPKTTTTLVFNYSVLH